jgi:hypothetical protein
MDFQIKKGYIIADSHKPGPLFVAPHAAPAYYKPGDHQDHNTHYVSYKLATYGGKALIAALPRERDIGIDFYRPYPTAKKAMESYEVLQNGKYKERVRDARRSAWAAKSRSDHVIKKEIYEKFWNICKQHRGPLVFVHRQFFNPVRHPSIMDVIPYNNKEQYIRTVSNLNEKYGTVLAKMFPVYKSGFEFKALCVDFKDEMAKHKMRLFHGRRPNVSRRRAKFRKVLKDIPELKITCMQNFKGVPLRKLMDQHGIKTKQPVFQAEISEFLVRRFPDIAVYMIRDILKRIEKEKKRKTNQ